MCQVNYMCKFCKKSKISEETNYLNDFFLLHFCVSETLSRRTAKLIGKEAGRDNEAGGPASQEEMAIAAGVDRGENVLWVNSTNFDYLPPSDIKKKTKISSHIGTNERDLDNLMEHSYLNEVLKMVADTCFDDRKRAIPTTIICHCNWGKNRTTIFMHHGWLAPMIYIFILFTPDFPTIF